MSVHASPVPGLRGLLPRHAPHGFMARFCLAMLATAGFFYVNILPALVDGLVTGLGFSTADAGTVASANIYGAAVGALAAVPLAGRLAWRPVCAGLLLLLMAIDGVSLLVDQPGWLTGVRFGHGCVGGLLVGLAYSIFARTARPAQTFGVLLVVQYGLGGLGVMLLPGLVPVWGAGVLFVCLLVFSATSLLLLSLLPDYPVPVHAPRPVQAAAGHLHLWPYAATLLALFLFQAGNNGPYAVIVGMGKAFALPLGYISNWLGIAAWLGMAGAVLVLVLAGRVNRLAPLSAAMLATVLATGALLWSDRAGVFALANCLVGITWAFAVAYLLGMAAEFDPRGRLAALAGFASKMGLATGSLVAAQLVSGQGERVSDYGLMLYVAVAALALAWLAAMQPAASLDREPAGAGALAASP